MPHSRSTFWLRILIGTVALTGCGPATHDRAPGATDRAKSPTRGATDAGTRLSAADGSVAVEHEARASDSADASGMVLTASATPGDGAGDAGTTTPAADRTPDAGAGLDLSLPASPPAKPSYEVPVADAQLAPYASFEVGNVSWRISDSDVWLSYTFPAALSGIDNEMIAFRGTLVAPGMAEIAGDAGSARCAFSAATVRCAEMMTGLKIDPDAARAALAMQPALEQNLRGQVIASFSGDPIGVLMFAAPRGNVGRDDDH